MSVQDDKIGNNFVEATSNVDIFKTCSNTKNLNAGSALHGFKKLSQV